MLLYDLRLIYIEHGQADIGPTPVLPIRTISLLLVPYHKFVELLVTYSAELMPKNDNLLQVILIRNLVHLCYQAIRLGPNLNIFYS